MHPKLVQIGDFFLPTYGVFVALGFLMGLLVATRLARRAGLPVDTITNLGVYTALAGLAGAKLLLIVMDWRYYAAHPEEIVSLSTLQAGGVFFGGLIAALFMAAWYSHKRGIPWLDGADVYAPALALGQAIGRLGCFSAGCCWGKPTSLPWAVTFRDPEAHRLVGVPLYQPLHPTQLYESAASFLIFAFLWKRSQQAHSSGQILGWYLVLSSCARFWIEFVRDHPQPNPMGGPFSLTQWLALALFLVGVWLVRWRNRLVLAPRPPKQSR